MFLTRLCEFSASSDEMPPPYHGWANVRWLLDLRADGEPEINYLADLATADDPTRLKGKREIIPDLQRSSPAPQPMLACDSLKNALGWTELPRDGETIPSKDLERARRCHEAFTALVVAWADQHPEDIGAQALCKFLASGGPKRLLRPEKYGTSDRVMFRVSGQIVHRSPTARLYWTQVAGERKGSGVKGLCLVCAEAGHLIGTFPRHVAKGLIPPIGHDPDSRSKNRPEYSSVTLASVNKSAMRFESGEQLTHSPICARCAESSVAALDHLLRSRNHTRRLGDTALTWWLLNADPDAIDPARLIFEPDDALIDALLADAPPPGLLTTSVRPNPRQVVKAVGVMIDSPRTGRKPGSVDTSLFCAAAVSANKTRLILRDWIDVPLPAAQGAVAAWFAHHRVLDPWTGTTRNFSLHRLALACGRWDRRVSAYLPLGDSKARRPLWVQRELLAAALRATRLPAALAYHLVQRLRADRHFDGPRLALLRLLLARTFHPNKEIPLALDDTNEDASYLMGRLFAVLESLQYVATKLDSKDKKLNTTLADRYLSAASTSPARVMPELLRGSQAHLKKLRSRKRDGVAVHYARLRDELCARVNPMPGALALSDQCTWFNGYADQRNHFFAAARARGENPEEVTPEAAETGSAVPTN